MAGVSWDRAWKRLMTLAEFTEPSVPWTRRAFTPEHAAGRQWLEQQFRAAGLAVRIDAAGNLIGRREGTDPAAGTIMVGSHSDTVRGGGRFDGIAGVISGLEIAAGLDDAGHRLRHAFEVVDFLAEEPNPYGISCIGSRGMSGQLSPDMLERVDAAGVTLRQRLIDAGATGPDLGDARRSDIKAFLELHIEQGPVLEAEGCDIGLVTAIAGIRRWAFRFQGQAAHAGTTPYPLRRDALSAAAHFIKEVPRLVAALLADAPEGGKAPLLIATVGQLEISPNAANVVPGEARLTLDIRSDSAALLEFAVGRFRMLADRMAENQRVVLAEARELSASQPAQCDYRLLAHLRHVAMWHGRGCMEMVSGAGHDAAFLSLVAPTAMLFVPSRGGLSHTPEEWTGQEEWCRGLSVLANTVSFLDGRESWEED